MLAPSRREAYGSEFDMIRVLGAATMAVAAVVAAAAPASAHNVPFTKGPVSSTLSICQARGSDGYRYGQWHANWYCSQELGGYALWYQT